MLAPPLRSRNLYCLQRSESSKSQFIILLYKMNTFRNEQYTITTSLADHNIIVNVVNNISCVEYERIFNPRAIGLSFSLDDTFTLINKCFTGSSKVEIELIQNTGAEYLMVKFYYIVDGLLEMHFIVRLVEKRGRDSSVLENRHTIYNVAQ